MLIIANTQIRKTRLWFCPNLVFTQMTLALVNYYCALPPVIIIHNIYIGIWSIQVTPELVFPYVNAIHGNKPNAVPLSSDG